MVTAFQNTQVLLLSGVLLAACLAKLAIRAPAPAPDHVHGVPLPGRLRQATALRHSRTMSVTVALVEGGLGVALLVTSQFSVRLATALAFAGATWVVSELRVRRPDAGCGCFGGLSVQHVDRRSVARALLFTAAALAALGAPRAGFAVLRDGHATAWLGLLVVELALFCLLSPEIPALLERGGLRRAGEPCERRHSPLEETMRTLRASAAWTGHEESLVSAVPLDVWREGCWRLLAYRAVSDGRPVELVFAVSTAAKSRRVRVAMVPAEDEPSPAIGKSTTV
ncbi:MauE/DoxX family redox-associated membrane protein [Actinomadura atramentaria]|uniref:MauE/DoxX family redox-associated membrane protein n=1 Tax=Actinomadura atramentaria TaxID=1990 RepID=UPI00036F992D|nr:MauE/DoxX family redox-associated membrane protein [Actinomadura atramentaria]